MTVHWYGMADFIDTVQHSSSTVTSMTADAVKQRECELHLDNVFGEAKAIKEISDFHCFEWQSDNLITSQYCSEIPISQQSTPEVIISSLNMVQTLSLKQIPQKSLQHREATSMQFTGATMITSLWVVPF